jgi:uncharacterized protein (UPF0335 family)
MKPDQNLLKKLLDKLSRTQQEEIDCQEVFELIDIYVETTAKGQDAGAMLPLVKHHLEMCAECLEEYEALLRILESHG